jgi:hypothetical protein
MLADVGNSEPKLLVAGTLALHDQPEATPRELQRELLDAGDGERIQAPWTPNAATILHYCRDGLAPAGVAERVAVRRPPRRHSVEAYQATDLARGDGLALTGALLDWSLQDYPFGLKTLLGTSASTGPMKAPETRFRIFRHLLKQPEYGATLADITAALASEGVTYSPVEAIGRSLRPTGILEEVPKSERPRTARSGIRLTHLARPAVARLVECVEDAIGGDNRDALQAKARAILGDVAARSQLLAQASERSSSIRAKHHEGLTGAMVMDAVSQLGGSVTVTQVMSALHQAGQPTYSFESTRRFLERAAEEGALQKAIGPLQEGRQFRIATYSAV